MNIVIDIPDDLAARLGTDGDIPRRAMEALMLEEFRAGRMTREELKRMLGFEVRNELDGFLKAHHVYEPYGIGDLERERQDLERLGF